MTHRESDDRGFSLIELLITVTIMGIAVVTVFEGLAVYYKGSSTQRSAAQLDQVVRAYSENLVAVPYKNCATSYPTVTLPTGFSLASGPTIRYWNNDNPASFGSSCVTDHRTQQISVTVQETVSSAKQDIVIVKTESG